MKETVKPIIFNTQMVLAILAGHKTVTRRVIDPGPHRILRGGYFLGAETSKVGAELDNHGVVVSKYQPGDILYVRETWAAFRGWMWGPVYVYKAGFDPKQLPAGCKSNWHWHPSIHMPKEAARIFLRVTNVRAERLQDIDEAGATAEGLYRGWRLTETSSQAVTARQAFMWLWDCLSRKESSDQSWLANPWVWVIEFERIDGANCLVHDAKGTDCHGGSAASQ